MKPLNETLPFEWVRLLLQAGHKWPGYTPEQDNPLFECQCEIERRMAATPALSAAGIAVKLRRWAHLEDLSGDDSKHLVLSALRDAERMAGEASS